MSVIELLLISLAVSMDAFAVSICKGLSVDRLRKTDALKVGLWFGGFQALMPLIGYFCGAYFSVLVSSIDHWIVFVLLSVIGGNMIKESFSNGKFNCNPDFSFRAMLPLALATSIDALAVGVTFAFLEVRVWMSVALIGLITMLFSIVGVYVGNIFGSRYKSEAEFAGGLILIVMGLKILIEHLTA